MNGGGSWGGQSTKTKAVQGWGEVFLVCQRPNEGRKSASVPTGSRNVLFSEDDLPVFWSCWASHEDWLDLFFPGTLSFLRRHVMGWRGRLLAKQSLSPTSAATSAPGHQAFPPESLSPQHNPSAHVAAAVLGMSSSLTGQVHVSFPTAGPHHQLRLPGLHLQGGHADLPKEALSPDHLPRAWLCAGA